MHIISKNKPEKSPKHYQCPCCNKAATQNNDNHIFSGITTNYYTPKNLNHTSPKKNKKYESDLFSKIPSSHLIDHKEYKKLLSTPNHNESGIWDLNKQKQTSPKSKKKPDFKNQEIQRDLVYLEGKNQLLVKENEFLKRQLMGSEKHTMDEVKSYQDRNIELMEHLNRAKWELQEMKVSENKNQAQNHMFVRKNSEFLFQILKTQEVEIRALYRELMNEPTQLRNKDLIMKIAALNREMFDINERNFQMG